MNTPLSAFPDSFSTSGIYIWCCDGLIISNLHLRHPQRVGRDAWGRHKEQPLLLSVALVFKKPFSTAASKDALDGSTLHYGKLSAALRDLPPSGPEWESLADFASRVQWAVFAFGEAPKLVQACRVQVRLPKASLLGDGISYELSGGVPTGNKSILNLSSVTIPVLIGVNSNERQAKQPLVFQLSLYNIPETASDSYTAIESQLSKV